MSDGGSHRASATAAIARSASGCSATRSWARRTSNALPHARRTWRGRRRSPRLVSIAGRNEQAVAAAARFGFERYVTDWRDLVADPRGRALRQQRPEQPARRADDRRRRGRQARDLREAAREDADESYEIWQRVAEAGVKHMTAFNYRFVPAVRLARQMIDAGELGEIHHFRGRYLQEWGPTDADGLALRQRGCGLRRAGRPRRARGRPLPLPRRRARVCRGVHAHLPARTRGRRCFEAVADFESGAVGTLERPASRPAARTRSVGDQRLEGVARVRPRAPERAAVERRHAAASAPSSSRRPTTPSGSAGGRTAT